MSSFKKRFRKLLFILIGIFISLFLFRLVYGYVKPRNSNGAGVENFINQVSQQEYSVKRNYASKKHKITSTNQAIVKVDQKYEKIAEITAKSGQFEKEEKQARKQIKSYQAIIQFEQKSGNKGRRRLNFQIGVPPENFDSLYQKLIKIGRIKSKQITKKDKTNEYKELNAKKASLEKIRTSLINLKEKGGKIEEYMQLENRILEVEQELQGLGVSLGNFDDENEFCTIQFSLFEGKDAKISFIHRVKVALEWTIKYYLRLIVILFFGILFAYLFLLTVDKLKIVEKIVKSSKE